MRLCWLQKFPTESLAMKQDLKHLLAFLTALLVVGFLSGFVLYAYTQLPAPHPDEADPSITFYTVLYADDPAMLYRTAGIRNCGEDFTRKLDRPMVLISNEDLARAKPLLNKQFTGEITAILYTNAPEGTEGMRGIPAFILLRKESETYCVLGIAGGHRTPLFLEMETKYQSMLQ